MGNSPSRFECRTRTLLAATALTPGLLKHGKEVDDSHFHASLDHTYASVLKATSKQYGIRLTGELVSCSACSQVKGDRPPTLHHSTRRATQTLGLVYIDTAGPYSTSLGGSRYVVMFVDSASRLQRPYGARKKRTAAIFSVVKRFVADMEVSRAFRTDKGTGYSKSMFVDVCNSLGIRHSRMDPSKALYRELSRLDTRRDSEFRNCIQTSTWKRSGVAPATQERAFGWSSYSGHRSASTGRQHQ